MKENLKKRDDKYVDVLQIGIGSTGISVLEEMLDRGHSEIECLGIDTKWDNLKFSKVSKKLLIGKNVTYGYRALSIEEAKEAAEEEEKGIRCYIEKAKKIYIAFEVSQYDMTGMGIIEAIAKIADEENVPITGLFFQLEEENEKTVEKVKEYLNDVITLCDKEYVNSKPFPSKDNIIRSQDVCDYMDWIINSGDILNDLIIKANDIVEEQAF